MSTGLKLTVPEYDAMVEKGAFDHLSRKIELIYGVIEEMNPAGPLHDDLIEYLTGWSVRNTKREVVRVRIQSGLSLPELDSRPEPDVLWVKARTYRDGHPTASDVLLAIEVAYSSLQTDRETKAQLYSEAGIGEYWIVNADEQVLHVFRDPGLHGYQTLTTVSAGGSVSPRVQPTAILDVADLFGHE